MWGKFLCQQITIEINPCSQRFITCGAYTDNQSLHDTVYSTKQTLEKQLIVDISSLLELGDPNEVKLCGQKRISRGTTKAFIEILESSKMLNMWMKIKKIVEEIGSYCIYRFIHRLYSQTHPILL